MGGQQRALLQRLDEVEDELATRSQSIAAAPLLSNLLAAAVLLAACSSGSGSSNTVAATIEPATTEAPTTTTIEVRVPSLADGGKNGHISEGRWQVDLGLASVSFESDGRLLTPTWTQPTMNSACASPRSIRREAYAR